MSRAKGMAVPKSDDIKNIIASAPGTDWSKHADQKLLERLQLSCYLDGNWVRLDGWKRLKHQYENDGLVLFLGAGVSKDSGIPDWNEVLDEILHESGISLARTGDRKSMAELLEKKAKIPRTALLDLCANEFKKRNPKGKFESLLRKALYGGAKFSPLSTMLKGIPHSKKAKLSHDWHPILDGLKKNPTLAAIGDFVMEETTPGSVRPNEKIHAVLTTNVDNLLQLYTMGHNSGKRILNTIDRASVGDHPGLLSIFHLHGWLDARDSPNENNVDETQSGLVFRESEYFDTFGNVNSFVNYTALSFLQRHNFLFIGASLEDVNIRRWLWTSFRERRGQRARVLQEQYGCEPTDAEVEAEYASTRHFWMKSVSDLPAPKPQLRKYVESSARHLGLEVLWYESHTEITERLKMLKAPENIT
jgi:SIR2-like domain